MITGTRLCRLLPKGRKNRPGDQLKNDQWNRPGDQENTIFILVDNADKTTTLIQGTGSAGHTTDSEGICLICRLWRWLSLQVREELGNFLGIGRKSP